MTPSTISIKLNGVDITTKVLFATSKFTSQANPMSGSFSIEVKDPDQTFAPVGGQKVTLHIDGVPLFGGYAMVITMGFFLDVVDTSVPAQVVRKWTLAGPDFNLIFDKRVLRNTSDYTSALEVPSGKRTISKAFTYLMDNFIDVPSGLDYTTNVDFIKYAYGEEQVGSLYIGQGKTLRDQMEDFMDHGSVIYYIDADFSVHLHAYETLKAPWLFMDSNPNGVTAIGFREGTYTKDWRRLTTDALVWGGSTIRKTDGGPGGDIVFARYPNPPANDVTLFAGTQSETVLTAEREQKAIDRRAELGRWQMGEERAGQNNYKTQDSVRQRAAAIVTGPPGAVPTQGVESGFGKAMETMQCTWFAHDVPGSQHVRPGEIMDFILYSQGDGGPLVTSLPLRSMDITFPTLPPTSPGDTYVRFSGDFGVAYSDRRYLWKAMRKQRQALQASKTTVVADGSAASIPPGATVTLTPIETPDGVNKVFTFQFQLFTGEFTLFINSLVQFDGISYSYNSITKQVTFITAPGIGDQIYATGPASQ